MHGSPTGEDRGNSEKGKRRKFWPPLLYARRQIPDSLSGQEGGNRSIWAGRRLQRRSAVRMHWEREKDMREKAEEAIRTAAETYCLLLFVVLPLYMRDGFVMIGDIKYQFFRNMTVLFLVLLSVLQLLWYVSGGKEGHVRTLSRTDLFMLGYLAAALLSFCFSMEHDTAFWGFSGWYMGLFSQLMFVWIYFILSRWCGNAEKIIWLCFFCALTVMVLGILNRYGFDPLGTMRGMDSGTWEAVHLLSTIGNQNWYCGYISVAASACFYFAYTGGKNVRKAGLAGCLITFLTILVQGSESGYLIPLSILAVLFVDALRSRKQMLRFLQIVICYPAAALLGVQGIRLRGLTLAEDGSLQGGLFWKGWAALFVLLGGSILALYIREKSGKKDLLESGRVRRAALTMCGILAVLGVSLFLLCQVSDTVWTALGGRDLLRITDEWGNGRGALWRISWEYFRQSPWYRKVFGAGPDCFYHAVYSVFAVNDVIRPMGQWETAVYANAHNEWLNMLINQGVLGLAGYAGVFGVSFVRLWKIRRQKKEAYWGILAIAGYCVHATVSFQQTVSTPLAFAVLGISEAVLRRSSAAKEDQQMEKAFG